MQRRALTILCLLVLGLAVSGCTKCDWIWDNGARSCRADTPR